MKGAAVPKGGSTFPARCSVVVVNPFPSSPPAPSEAEELLRPYVSGERGGKLRSQLAALHPDSQNRRSPKRWTWREPRSARMSANFAMREKIFPIVGRRAPGRR
jgi:hypothetical protein